MLLLISLPISVHIATAAAAAPQPQVIVPIPTLLRMCKAMQRASREMSGYFIGYTFKGQPVGKKTLLLNEKSLR